ncbi:MAG TPA: hypothetical protein VJQ52_23110 [Steroidobacteraceae bacterium]|nr:hypothetical protein [Steroidobacteraceae bacterium]
MRAQDPAAFVELGDATGSVVAWPVRLERSQNVIVGEAREAVQKAQAGDAVEPFHDLRMQRVAKIEQNRTIAREPICEQHPARAELVLGVVRPQALLADRQRGDDGAVPVAIRCEIDHGEKVAVLAVFVTCPGE